MTDPVRIEIRVEFAATVDPVSETVQIDRAEWDAMTPTQRESWCIEQAAELRDEHVSTGYTVLDADGVHINA